MTLSIAIICIALFAAGFIWLIVGAMFWMGDCIEAERNGEI